MKAIRAVAVVLGACLALCAGAVWLLFTRTETSTRVVCVEGRLCSERFNLKDGMPVEVVCPRQGGETYPLPHACSTSGGLCRCP